MSPKITDRRQDGLKPIKHAYLPLKASLAYLLGTFLLFLLGPFKGDAENLALTALFILSATALFAAGYHLSIVQTRRYRAFGNHSREVSTRVKVTIISSVIWFFVFSLASLHEYGATSLADIVNAAANPSASYFAKFDVYAEQQSTGRTNLPIQISVLTGALYFVLVPATIYFWRNLSRTIRFFAMAALLSYISYFVFIGTQKGLGDLVIMGLAALAASKLPLHSAPLDPRTNHGHCSKNGAAAPKNKAHSRQRIGLVVLLVSLGFTAYIANNQGDRLQGLSIESQFVPNPVVASIFGEQFARGLSAASYYPTNGYIGLSKNLTVPFEWAGGLGGAPALAGYKTQYLGGDNPFEQSYPVRTEAETGWPAGLLWATVYPWLASDLTFPGAALFMSVVGWFTARTWLGARIEHDLLSLILFCQAALFIVYIPANNQLMSSRYTAIGLLTMLGVYAARRLVGAGSQRGVATLVAEKRVP